MDAVASALERTTSATLEAPGSLRRVAKPYVTCGVGVGDDTDDVDRAAAEHGRGVVGEARDDACARLQRHKTR